MRTRAPLLVKCPACGTEVPWGDESPWRPFCSKRCKDADFLGWAEGDYSIPAAPAQTWQEGEEDDR